MIMVDTFLEAVWKLLNLFWNFQRFKQDKTLKLVRGKARAMEPSWELPKAKRFKFDKLSDLSCDDGTTFLETFESLLELPEAKRFKQDKTLKLADGKARAMEPSWELPKAKRIKITYTTVLSLEEYRKYLACCEQVSIMRKEQKPWPMKTYKESLIDYLLEQPIALESKNKMLDIAFDTRDFNPINNNEEMTIVIDE